MLIYYGLNALKSTAVSDIGFCDYSNCFCVYGNQFWLSWNRRAGTYRSSSGIGR